MRDQARVLFDSAQMMAAIDARSIASEERSLLFSLEGISVDLVIYPSEGGLFVMHGQVIDAEVECPIADATVSLGDPDTAVETDEFGQFSLSAVGSPDGIAIHIDTGTLDVECVVPQVHAVARGV